MSVILTAVAAQSPASSTTVRQFQRAVGLALAAVVVGCLIYAVETCLFGFKRRLVENPTDAMMRALGLAHFLVGWLFLFSSPRLRGGRALGRLFVATVSGGLLCAAFAGWGGTGNLLLVVLFYALFLVHEIGDEAELFQAYGDGPRPGPEHRAFLASLKGAVSLFLITVLVLSHLLFAAAINKTAVLDRLPPFLVPTGVGMLLLCCAWACYRTTHLGRHLYGRMGTILAVYQPLFRVYAGIFTILVLGSFLGSVGFNLIILVHVAAWFLFAYHQLGKRPAPSTTNPWTWLRSTPAGFLVLHLGMALAVLVLMGLRVHSWERSGLVSQILAKSSFYYWSIMHICMSFGRPR